MKVTLTCHIKHLDTSIHPSFWLLFTFCNFYCPHSSSAYSGHSSSNFMRCIMRCFLKKERYALSISWSFPFNSFIKKRKKRNGNQLSRRLQINCFCDPEKQSESSVPRLLNGSVCKTDSHTWLWTMKAACPWRLAGGMPTYSGTFHFIFAGETGRVLVSVHSLETMSVSVWLLILPMLNLWISLLDDTAPSGLVIVPPNK